MSETQTTTGNAATGTFTVKVPDVGEGVAEVEIVSWSVAVGDTVARLQTVAEVMTDKATVEVPSPVDGVVTELGGEVGEVLLVGSPLIHLGLGSASAVATEEFSTPPAAKPPPPQRPPRATESPESSESPESPESSREQQPEVPAGSSTPRSAPHPPGVEARPHATGAPLSSSGPAPGGGAGARSTNRPATVPFRTVDGRVLATPAVRRRARDLGVDLRRVGATGPAGRVTHADLDAYLAADSESGFAVGRSITGGGAAARVPRTGAKATPVVGLRRRIAQQMVASTSTIPHITYVDEVDMTALEELRATLNRQVDAGGAQVRLTLLPFLVRALTNVTVDFPRFNAHLDDSASRSEEGGPDVLTVHEGVHVGIATQTDNGLIVPVLRHAEAHTVWSAANAIAEITEATRTGKAAAEDLSGSTITISSLGALGGIVSTPVIKQARGGHHRRQQDGGTPGVGRRGRGVHGPEGS